MKRIVYSMVITLVMANAAFGLSLEEKFLIGLRAQGFSIIEKGYTIFGRLRILAENRTFRREIVVNPNTGEILRDYSVLLADLPNATGGAIVANTSAHRNTNNKRLSGAAKDENSVAASIASDDELTFDPSSGNEPNAGLGESAVEVGGGANGTENVIVVVPPTLEINNSGQND